MLLYDHIHSYSCGPEESRGLMNNVVHDLCWPTMPFISKKLVLSEPGWCLKHRKWFGMEEWMFFWPCYSWNGTRSDKDTQTLFISDFMSVSHTHTRTKPVLLSSVAGCRGVKCRWTVSDRRWRPWCHPVWSHKDWLLGDRKLRSEPRPWCGSTLWRTVE